VIVLRLRVSLRGAVCLVGTAAAVACSAATIGPGHSLRGHRLITVEEGASLSRMPRQRNCPAWEGIDAFTRELRGRRVNVLMEFTVTGAGRVESVSVIRSSYPPLNEAAVIYLESCAYEPPADGNGKPVWARVQWQLIVEFG